jgi:flavin-dependent dehydrogenase
MAQPPHASAPPDLAPDLTPDQVDVAVLGGGITGLTLALQLLQTVPGIRVCVIERAAHPVAEAAHKVGESSVEIQAHYLRTVLGLQEHLDSEQLRKFGLRMFFPQGDNTDITHRVEYGQIAEAPLPSYQLDRGRLENRLGELVRAAGGELLDGHRAELTRLGEPGQAHLVSATGPHPRRFEARWVVDATGRAGLLKRRLGLARELDHKANASWFRVDHPIDVGSWSTDEAWQARVPSGQRRLSTNHLMGPGSWVWVIPLGSGATSVGIVADDRAHPRSGFNTLDRAIAWLGDHEPQLAAAVRAQRERILDFRVMRDYAYSTTQVYSGEQRWCLTGEAGVSIDPLYSSGGDLMAISNGLITDLVQRDLAGEDVRDAAAGHNQIYLVLAEIWLIAYRDQYPLMGNARVMVAKVIWDTIIYWAVPGLLYFHDSYRRLAASATALPALYRTWEVHGRIQQFLREWAVLDTGASADAFADPYSLLDFIVDLHTGMAAGLDPEALEAQLVENVALLEQVGGQLVTEVSHRLRTLGDIGARARQLSEWAADPLLGQLVDTYDRTRGERPIDPAWITLGDRTEPLEVTV